MGIDFSHCGAHWAYSGFMRFRTRLAETIGIDYVMMAGLGGRRSWETIKDPIVPLLNHSDCDGELSPDECRAIAPRLRELVSTWPEDDSDRLKAIELANGMDDAALSNEPLVFR